MPHPIQMWENLYYYPGSSTDLTTLLAQRECNRDAACNSIVSKSSLTLYSLVTFTPTEEVQGIEKVVIQLCSFSLVKGEKTIRQSVQSDLKRLLFPDPKIWSVRPYEQLVNVDEFGLVQVALGTLSFGFINPVIDPQSTYGIATAKETEALRRFRAMVIRLEREALGAVFMADEEDEDEDSETVE